MNSRAVKRVLLFFLELTLIAVLFFSCPASLSPEKQRCYFVLCAQLPIFWTVQLLIMHYEREIDLLSPLLLVTLIHMLLFEFTPLLCLLTNDLLLLGQDLWGGCIKGTWLSTIGFLAFTASYLFSRGNRSRREMEQGQVAFSANQSRLCLKVNVVFWILAFLAQLYYLRSTGKNLAYVLTLGSSKLSAATQIGSATQFLGVIAYAMLPSYLYIFVFSKKRIWKILLFYLMTVTFVARGFRFIIVAIIVSPLVLLSLIKEKRPRLRQIMLVFLLLVIMITVVGSMRYDYRAGKGITERALNRMTLDAAMEAVKGNFEIFKAYYGIVEHIPSVMGYTHGKQIIYYTAVMMIPRFLWHGKPQPPMRDVIRTSVCPYAVNAGMAYPYVGEYYHEFGVLGVIAGCFLLGLFCKWLARFKNVRNIHAIVLFATVYPLMLQVLIRGYTPSNFYMLFFVIIPIVISASLDRNVRHAEERKVSAKTTSNFLGTHKNTVNKRGTL